MRKDGQGESALLAVILQTKSELEIHAKAFQASARKVHGTWHQVSYTNVDSLPLSLSSPAVLARWSR